MTRLRLTPDLFSGVLLVLIGGGGLYGAVSLGLGTPDQPEAGFFPFLAALGVFIFSVQLVIQAVRHPPAARTDMEGAEPDGSARGALIMMAGMLAFVLVLDTIGFVLSTALIVAVILYVFDVRKALTYALGIPVIAVGSYLLFHTTLGLPLPTGPLGF